MPTTTAQLPWLLCAALALCPVLMVSAQCGTSAEGDVRLVNSGSFYWGFVEICFMGEWQPVCADGFNTISAVVVCRQLGLAPPPGLILGIHLPVQCDCCVRLFSFQHHHLQLLLIFLSFSVLCQGFLQVWIVTVLRQTLVDAQHK